MKRVFIVLILNLALLPLETAQGMVATEPAHVGLNNIGSTCYMNASLQCLIRTQPLYNLLIKLSNEVALSCNQSMIPEKDKDKFNAHKTTLSEFIQLNKIFSTATEAIYPNAFHAAFMKSAITEKALKDPYSPTYGAYNKHHDAAEAIALFMTILTFEVQTKPPVYNNSTDGVIISPSEMTYPFAISTQLTQLFNGAISITRSFKDCNHLYKTIELIQKIELECKNCNTLEKCLNLFTQKETMAAEEPTYCTTDGCPNYMTGETSYRTISLQSIPSILITTLKRFNNNGNKINTPIAIPEKLSIDEKWTTEDCPQKNTTYELYGLIMHSGSLSSGHYWAYVKDAATKQWWTYNDSSAYQAIPNLNDPNIYAAFYCRTPPGQEDTDTQQPISRHSAAPGQATTIDIATITTALEVLSTKLTALKTQLETLKGSLEQLKNNVVGVQQGSH